MGQNYYNKYNNFAIYFEIINSKIKREHLTNYLKHSFRMYKNK
jgi:hypothetical protein